ncbi:non-ribosomal peptide synthetase [Desulfobacula phenolica]|uniref:Non-ribosomal peptide synthase domain TIGR01720/amino acid adenylation domain-containing protein n=1 Tax=Desulfobacula phenolica TaxID=90732 RepID=A0A1H2DNI6_9BACT|nr:non-ribosomal peptide synthetase [Desulfobacula phenolica]SDT84455.1 non-ribosomal peptide synthase domain TIGR01720/amino acid adenylation domain-containing protein [Desulfobacula phenolica]
MDIETKTDTETVEAFADKTNGLNGKPYELSPLQEGMLIHSLAEQGVGMYVSQGVHSFRHIDAEAMEHAWQKVVDRHEVLRTSFVWENLNKPLQVVHPKVEVRFEHYDLRKFSEWEQKIKLRAILGEDRAKGFELTRPPLFRLHLLKRSEDSYYLIFSHHHLLLDGWSNPILLDEVRTFYQGLLKNIEVAMPHPKPFRLYIQWLRKQELKNEKKFWETYLKGFKRTTPLPYDLGSHRQEGYPLKSEELHLEVKDPLFTNLKATARKCKVTLNTLIQAAWCIILSRYSGHKHIVFGSLVSGRSSVLEGIETMIGMFLNTLPLHIKVDAKASFKDWLKYVHIQQTLLHEHEFSPLAKIQQWSELPRGIPLFESVIDTNNTHQVKEESDETVLAPITQSVPMLLFTKPAAGRLLLILIYNNRRFIRPCIAQVGEQIIALLSDMCKDVQRTVEELSMISEAESQRTLVTWNKTRRPYPEAKTLHQLFEAHAESSPDAPAVHYLDKTMSYKVFNQKANQLARHLVARGIGRGELVGFCLDRSFDMVIVLMAILKSGAGYIPLDPNYPFDRLEMMLKNSEAKLLIIQEKYLSELGGISPHHLCIDKEAHLWSDQDFTNLDLELSPDDIAYVLYSSGSTGVPKGIVIPHKQPVNRMFIEFDPFEPDEALCAKTSICFVDSVWELWSAWANGLPLTLIPESQIKDPASLIETLALSGSTRMVLVPSLLRSMMDTEPELEKKLPRMKHWICSGEALPGDLSERFVKTLPNAVLTNLYGATEVWDVTRCDTRDNLPYDPMPIGKTMGNMKGYILNDKMQPVPVGVIGELHFSGVHMAHGYWKRPYLTARQFVPNPFSSTPGQRLYKTGDLGRWLPDGNFEYICRRDHQIQLRGFRIELGDIESVIRGHADIKQAAVVVSDDERLVAYIVTKTQTVPSAAELRKHVRLKLPEHMTPAFYLPLAAIPLTPNGKTDRRKLPKPKAREMKQLIEKEASSRAPETPTEKTVASVWANYLGLDTVGAESDFFQLGGESLMAVRIITQLGKILKITIPLSVLMETRTIADMAAWIDQALKHGTAALKMDMPAISKADHGKKAPLSHAQQQMWLLDQLNPGSVSYTVPNIIQLRTIVDMDALNKTLTELIRRHEILRTTFLSLDGDPFQVIREPENISVPITDLTDLPAATREMAIDKKIREQARLPWDLENGPLFRYQLIKINDKYFSLAMTLHHIITDGRSMSILTNEIKALYNAFSNGKPSPLNSLTIQYADYAIWQRKWLKGDQINKQIQYWKHKLDDTSILEIPTDHPRPAVNRYRGGNSSICLDPELVRELRRLGLEEGATMFMVLLATFQLLLMRYTGQNDICVGTPSAGRSQHQLEALIGYFINTLVLRTRISGNPSFRELIQNVRTTCIEAYDNQDVPFEILVDKLGVQRDLSINPLFQVLFVHQRLSEAESGKTFERRTAPEQETANFDLVLNVQESLDRLECKFVYNSDLFEKTTIDRMGARLELLIRQCVTHPDQALSRTVFLLPEERRQILLSFSHQKKKPVQTRCTHEIIADHALAYPEKAAIRFNNDTVTYLELEQQSNRMARHLITLGAGPETVVGWCVERNSNIFAGLLGIMKSGSAFLPLDPAQPKERLSYMLKDTKSKLIITQKKLVDTLPSDLCRIVLLDDDSEFIKNTYDPLPTDLNVRPENLAYIIYTSGSTGMPKGVMVEHRNLVNLISSQIPEFRVTVESRVLQTLSLSFDAALGEIFRTFVAGATLHLAHKDDLMPGPALIELLKIQKITSVAFSAAALAALPKASHDLVDLKNLTVGGDTISPELVAHWCRNRRFMNGYGPTETTIGATLAANWDSNDKPPLGRPLPNVKAYVLDRWMQPVPVGTPGELHIGGVGVTRGYLNRPDQTAASFIPDPFSNRPGERLYRTGDLVRWLPDGKLDFLGRMDHQVKIRGFRIELSEIESVLDRHPKVNQAVVVVHKTNGIKRLAAYVTPMKKEKPDSRELRLYLQASLPDYMVPAFLIICDSFPMTVNGKIDRKALPEPSSEQLQLDKEYVAPRNDLEKLIARIWADVLGLERVGIFSNYFELGGDSIMSIRVVARITEAGYQLSLKDMFTHQTVAELALSLESGSSVLAAEQGMIKGAVSLTPVQQWFFNQESSNIHHFNQWMAVPTPPVLDCDKMRQAVAEVASHHDALRMRFKKTDRNGWTQFNSETIEPIPFNEVDLTSVPDNECREIIDQTLHKLQRTLDMEQGPLFRVCWFNPGPHRPGRLLVLVHHIIMDIVSWTPLIEDLMVVYRQLSKSQPVKLPMKTSSFKQWAKALKDYGTSEELKKEMPYWLDLAEHPPQPLPIDFSDKDHSHSTTQSFFMDIEPAHTRQLIDIVAPWFNTPFSNILLAALAIAFHRYSTNKQIQITVEGQGREDIGVEMNLSRTLGWFTSFYPMAFSLDSGPALEDQIKKIIQKIEAVPNRGIGYSVLRYLSEDQRIHAVAESEISFNFTGQSSKNLYGIQKNSKDDKQFWGDLAEMGKIKLSESTQGPRRHLIEIGAGVMDDRLIVRFAYGGKRFKQTSIQSLAQNLKHVFSEMVQVCEMESEKRLN